LSKESIPPILIFMTSVSALTHPAPLRGPFARRATILDTAARVFAREGFSGTSIDAIAAEAGVSRQTVYNQIGDKERVFAAVVADATERANASLFATLSTFPDNPRDLEPELGAFAERLAGNCLCDCRTAALRKIIDHEGYRYPALSRAWREQGPGRVPAALAARLLRLAHRGLLDIDDPDLAARQFLTLVHMDLRSTDFAKPPTGEDIRKAAAAAVRMFLRAYRPSAAAVGVEPAVVG
jgi:AcrR family transcriptional regulator